MAASCIALVLAAGTGQRMGLAVPKQYYKVSGKPLLFYTLLALSQVSAIDQLAVVIAPQDRYFDQFNWSSFSSLKVLRVGGGSRLESAKRGIATLQEDYPIQPDDWLLVHDAVRCYIQPEHVTYLINALQNDAVGGLLALPITDTLKKSNTQERVVDTINRSNLWLAQTPQMFRAHLLVQALMSTKDATDEASAIESLGYQPVLVRGRSDNIKITYPEDLKGAMLRLPNNQ